ALDLARLSATPRDVPSSSQLRHLFLRGSRPPTS
ncbi:hypothetical protein JMJ78_0008166, partial [Colletotrichum scovillei]